MMMLASELNTVLNRLLARFNCGLPINGKEGRERKEERKGGRKDGHPSF